MTDLTAFREEVIEFLTEATASQNDDELEGLVGSTKDETYRFQQALHKKGWGAPGWPKEHGGCGWSQDQMAIFSNECARMGAPYISPFGLIMVGPVIYTFGNDAQKQKHLPGIMSGETFWCQGYSEPGSGSDLASLKTRAVRDGDDYIVNGQKIWTTQAHWADWIFCLVRTDTESKPQAGISFLLIDLKSPGIEVRPITSIDGLHHLNEVFFTDVRVPAENLVGNENEGWTYAKFLLVNERSGIAQTARHRRTLESLNELAGSLKAFAEPPINDPEIKEALDAMDIRVEGLAALETRALTAPSQSMDAVKLTAPLKLIASEIEQDLEELSVRIAGPAALVGLNESDKSEYDQFGENAVTGFLMGRSHSIYGGTSEVQKNIIAGLMMRGA